MPGGTAIRARDASALLLLALIWGSEWLATQAVEEPPLGALAIRYMVAALVLSAIMVVRGIPRPGRRQAAISALTGLGFLVLPAMLIIWASGRISPGLLVVLLAMTPLIAALLEGRASGRLLPLLVGGVAGTMLISAQGLSFALTQWAGAAAGLAAALLIAGSIVHIKRALGGVHPVAIAAIQFGAAAVALAAASLTLEARPARFSGLGSAGWTLALALLGNAFAVPLYYALLRQVESFQLTASQWLATAVGVVEGLALERAWPPWRIAAGLAVLSASLAALWKMRTGDDEMVTIQFTPPPAKS